MFICNLKINGGRALKIIILVLSLFMLFVFGISIYKIFFTSGKFNVNDKLKAKNITELDALYVLKANAPINTEAHANARAQLASGKVKFLRHERIAKNKLLETKVG